MHAINVQNALKTFANKEKAAVLARFFKTGPGEYGEGDIFIGVTVPNQRTVAKKYKELPRSEISLLLRSEVHEHRLTALLILVERYENASVEEKDDIVEFYLKNTEYINNWDLVDLSAPKILGAFVLENPTKRKMLYAFAKSKHLWEKRIAIVATMTLIRNGEFEDTLKISEILLHDTHDLIHKAVGWMLREVGKKDQGIEEQFLKKHYTIMPRTMLRYAIERFDDEKRRFYMKRSISTQQS